MKAFIFTHGPDYPMAAIATAALDRLGVRSTWVVDMSDNVPDPEVPLVFTSTPRNYNLNGLAWTITQLETMLAHAGDSEWVLKVDSDTLVLSLDWLHSVSSVCNFCGIYSNERQLYGCCYAIRASIIPRLIDLAKCRVGEREYGEDLIMAELLDSSGTSNIRHPYKANNGIIGFWCNDGQDKKLARSNDIVCVQRPVLTPRGRERDDVISSMKAISKYAGIP